MSKLYKPDFKRLDELTEEGYLRKVISPCGRLMLYNYTDKTTFEKKWNKHTLNARGTVYEISSGKVVARAFPKFFNFGELPSSKSRNLAKQTDFEVFEKMDGSLGIIYNYDDKWYINTRGSFTSEQAIKGAEILKKYDIDKIAPRVTLLVEIIYPENRIIVPYGEKEELVILGAILRESGTDLQIVHAAEASGMPMASSNEFVDIDHLQREVAEMDKFEEGFVVRFRKTGERVKFKSAEYLKLARLMSNMTLLNFWRNMEEGRVSKEMLQELPEEFEGEIKVMKKDLEFGYAKVELQMEEDYHYAVKSIGGLMEDGTDKKRLGLWIKEYGDELKFPQAMFAVHAQDKKSIDKLTMRAIKPKNNKVVV